MKILVRLAGHLPCKYWLAACMLCVSNAYAQSALSGMIMDEMNNEPVIGAAVRIQNTFLFTVTDVQGKFSFTGLKNDSIVLEISHLAYEQQVIHLKIPSNDLSIHLKSKTFLSDEVTITATRVDTKSAIAFTNVDKKEIEAHNFGQDIPFLLNLTPSVVVTSDAGTGIGYTGIRIRGSDGTRVNVTLNGIPVNDAESHQVYWVDLPDLASSVENIQVQRGLGTSTNGSGAFGGSINILTNQLRPKPYTSLNTSFGSFNSLKNTVSFGSGMIGQRFSFEGRLSKISSDGYIDRGSSDLKSFYFSGGYYGSNNSLRFIILSGKEKTYQAWYGLTQDSLSTNRTFNAAGMYYDANGAIHYYDNQTDNYRQDYYQLLFSHQFNRRFTFNAALHYTKGKGYYEEYAAGDYFSTYGLNDVIRPTDTLVQSDFTRQRWLDNDFYGFTWSLNYNYHKIDIKTGGSGNRYTGEHFGELLWAKDEVIAFPPMRYYEDFATKNDFTVYSKFSYALTSELSLYTDLQYRKIHYEFIGLNAAGNDIPNVVNLDFFNPKAGVNYTLSDRQKIYFSFSTGHKEPVRDDYVNSSPTRPQTETLFDYEAGYNFSGNNFSAGVNTYYMDYNNQLILSGKINDVGEPVRQNVARSYRAGIEIELQYNLSSSWLFRGNATVSKNKIDTYLEHLYNEEDYSEKTIVYRNTDISFSPKFIAAGSVSWIPFKSFRAELTGKYVGDQNLDNTGNANRKLDSYFIQDIRLHYSLDPKWLKETGITIMLNNILDRKYESNGYTYSSIRGGQTSTYNYYYPQAGRNWMLGITLKF